MAAGVFAPGHLGELTRQVPFELVDAVLEETATTQRRVRELPSRVGVYFMLALGLFPRLGYRKVWKKLVTALGDGSLPDPSAKALRGPAGPHRPRTGEGVVRGAGRPGGPAPHAWGALRPLAYGRL